MVASSLGAKLSLEEILAMCNIFFGTLACDFFPLHWMLRAMIVLCDASILAAVFANFHIVPYLFMLPNSTSPIFVTFWVFSKKSLTKVARNVTDIIGQRRNSSFTALSDGEVVATWGSSRWGRAATVKLSTVKFEPQQKTIQTPPRAFVV